MKTFPGNLKITVLATVGIGAMLAIVSYAQTSKPTGGVYVLTINDYVPVKDKAKFEAAMRGHTKDKMKWKDDQGNITDVPSGTASITPLSAPLQTAQVITSEKARATLITVGSNVTQTATFNTATDLKAVVDTLQ